MQKALKLALQIRNNLDKDWRAELEEYGLHKVFFPIYKLNNANLEDLNRIICYIIYAYSPDSLWLDIKKDRIDNKKKILHNLDADLSKKIFKDIVSNSINDIIGTSIFSFLEELKDWRWKVVFDLLEYSARMSRFANAETSEEKTKKKGKGDNEVEVIASVDIDIISKVNKEKGQLLQMSIEKRKQADDMINEIRKEFVATDNSVQGDFSFSFTESAKKKDIMSWADFIHNDKENMKRAI